MAIDFGYTFQQTNEQPSLRTRVNKVLDKLDCLHREAYDLWQMITTLEQSGIIDAKPYWIRKDDPDGKPDQLDLTHPVGSAYHRQTGHRRQYIGTDPAKIADALDKINRFEKHQELSARLDGLKNQIALIERSISQLEYVVLAKQTRFLG